MSKHRILPPARILTHVGFSFLAILIAALCLTSYVSAENIYQTKSMEAGKYWGSSGYWSGAIPSTSTANNYFVGQGATGSITFRTLVKSDGKPAESDKFPDGNTLWLGYNTDGTFSSAQGAIALKSWNFTINNLQLGNSLINQAMKDGTANMKGAMTVNGTVTFKFSDAADRIINVQSAISGAGEITLVEGSNNENLVISSANNAFTGTLTVSKNSTVRLDGSNALQNATSVFIDTGATLFVNAAQTFQNNVITGSGTLRVSVDSDTLTNAVSDQFTGIINIRNGKQLTYSKPLTSNYSLVIANDSQFRIFNQTQQTQLECDIRLTGEGRDILTNVKAGALVFQGLTETSTVKGKVTLFGDALIGAYGSVSMASFTNEIETNGYTLKFRQTRQAGTNNVATFSIESDVLSSSGTGTIQFVSDQSPSVNDTFLCFGDPSAAEESAPTSQSVNVNMINYNKHEIVFQPGENRTVTVSGNLATDSSGNKKGYIKNGDGTLVLNGGLAAPMTVNAGVFELAGAAIENVTGIITVNNGGTLEYNVASGDEKTAAFTNTAYVLGNGDILKTGEGRLKINTEQLPEDLHFTADIFVVDSGRLDLEGYMLGSIEVYNDSIFSPGNSVGTSNIDGNITFKSNESGVSNGVALFEFGEYADGAEAGIDYDLFIMENGGTFTADNGVILLDFTNYDEDSWAKEGNVFQLVSGGGFDDNVDYNPWLGNMTDLFKLEGRSNDGLYLVGIKAAPEPGSGVPEPSTWALLALGAAGLMFWRKRKN